MAMIVSFPTYSRIIHKIYDRSLESISNSVEKGSVPRGWKRANLILIF